MVARNVALLAMAIGLAACAINRSEQLPFASGSQSTLNRSNFHVVRANVQGVSYGFNLFGFIPILSPSGSSAMHDIHQQVQAEGKAIALVNVVQDRTTTYLILFSLPKLTVSADAIEFLDEPGSAPKREPAS
jgi:hypothetical protein